MKTVQTLHGCAPAAPASLGRSVCPQPQPRLQPRHTGGPLPTTSGQALCHCTPWQGAKSLLGACLGSLATLHPVYGHVCAVLAESSSISSSYIRLPMLALDEGAGMHCTGTRLLPVASPWPSSCPQARLHPAAVPAQAELTKGPRDPSSAQTDWAEPPAHHTQMCCIYEVVPRHYLK